MFSRISIDLDVAFVFDILSIQEVKLLKGVANHTDVFLLKQQIKDQLGSDFFYEIFNDEIYDNLFKVNLILFEKIDLVRQNDPSISAMDIDNLNTERFKLKNELQKKFFKTESSERKNI